MSQADSMFPASASLAVDILQASSLCPLFPGPLCNRSLKVYIAYIFNFQILLSQLKFSIITI